MDSPSRKALGMNLSALSRVLVTRGPDRGSELVLEIGPGSVIKGDKGYQFRPRVWGNTAVYLDLTKPPRGFDYSGNFVIGDAHALPFRKSSFHIVCASHIVEHLTNPEQCLLECHRILREKGEIFVWTPNFLDSTAVIDPTHKHKFNALRLRRMLQRCNFKVTSITNVGDKVPRGLRLILMYLELLFAAELRVKGVKV